MDLALASEQEVLRRTAREFAKRYVPKAVVRQAEDDPTGFNAELWKGMVDLGWMGWVVPPEYGGVGGSFLDMAILLEEMGRACVPGPFFSTVVLGCLPILDMASEEQKQAYLPDIASGKAIFTMALAEPGGQYDAASVRLKATGAKDAYVLSGTKLFVPDAHIANYLLCVARTSERAKGDGITIFVVDAKSPGITTTVLKTIARDGLCEVVFDRVSVPKQNILGKLDEGWNEVQKTLERAAVGKCCEMLGGMQAVLDMTVEHAKMRKQFDRPIGSFQVIQHHCTNMATDVDGSRLVTYEAAWKLNEGLPCSREVAVAKAWVSEAYRRIIVLAHQIHGAIGCTMEYDLHFYSRRAEAAAVSFGDADFYREKIAQEIGL